MRSRFAPVVQQSRLKRGDPAFPCALPDQRCWTLLLGTSWYDPEVVLRSPSLQGAPLHRCPSTSSGTPPFRLSYAGSQVHDHASVSFLFFLSSVFRIPSSFVPGGLYSPFVAFLPRDGRGSRPLSAKANPVGACRTVGRGRAATLGSASRSMVNSISAFFRLGSASRHATRSRSYSVHSFATVVLGPTWIHFRVVPSLSFAPFPIRCLPQLPPSLVFWLRIGQERLLSLLLSKQRRVPS